MKEIQQPTITKERMLKNAILYCKKILLQIIKSDSSGCQQEIAYQIITDFFNIFEDMAPITDNPGDPYHKIDPFDMISPILEFSSNDVEISINHGGQILYLTSVEGEPQSTLAMKTDQVTINTQHKWYQSYKDIILNPTLQLIAFTKSIFDSTQDRKAYNMLLHEETFTWHM